MGTEVGGARTVKCRSPRRSGVMARVHTSYSTYIGRASQPAKLPVDSDNNNVGRKGSRCENTIRLVVTWLPPSSFIVIFHAHILLLVCVMEARHMYGHRLALALEGQDYG